MPRWLLVVALFAGCSPAFANPADVAAKYLHVRERSNRNDHPEITRVLAHAGLGPGYAWCQGFAADCVDTDAKRRVMPKTASVHQGVKWALRNKLLVTIIRPRDVLLGREVPRGFVVAFKHGLGADAETFAGNGHAALVDEPWRGATGRTIEGNTKPGPGGDQRGASTSLDGGRDGVYRRTRSLGLTGSFPIVLFYLPRV